LSDKYTYTMLLTLSGCKSLYQRFALNKIESLQNGTEIQGLITNISLFQYK